MTDSAEADLRALLQRVAVGGVSVDEALALAPLVGVARLGEYARLDTGRHLRKGVPEVVYAPGKSDEALRAIALRFLEALGLALISRLESARSASLAQSLEAAGAEVVYSAESRILEARTDAYRPPAQRGRVALLTAGTSDVPAAEEAAVVAGYMGCAIDRAYDVGVAGIHRLASPLEDMLLAGADVFVVAAGMEGALPSVVAGLVDVPVVGLPTSTGYGLGGDGTAALLSMLQSCSPGLVVVNVDNGVGAGAAAALIARGRQRRP